MITFSQHALDAAGIPSSPAQAVFAARDQISDTSGVVSGKGCQLIAKLLGIEVDHNQFVTEATSVKPANMVDYELTVTQAVVETLVKNIGVSIDEVDVLIKAKARALKFMTDPSKQFYFAKAESVSSGQAADQVAVSSSVDVKVAVNADGKIKKGGKEVLAIALYEKHVKSAATPMTNQEFIQVLVTELGMSKAGATTYNYNMKKKFGGTITPKGTK